MKARLKVIASVLLAAFLGGCMPALAAVPLRWTVETSRAQPASFDAYRGETLNLSADLYNYGKPLSLTGDAQLFYQTNNMTGWWTAPATISSNRIEATFSPSMDPGANQLYCFLGVTGSIYRAAFRLRLLNAPGAEPGNLPLPPLAIDFARVTAENAPWIPKEGGIVEQIRVTDKIYLGTPPPAEGQGFVNVYLAARDGSIVTKSPEGRTVRIVDEYNFYDVFWEMFGEYLGSMAGMVTEHDGSISELASTVSELSTAQAQDHATIAAWQTYWDGDDVRLTVTNYYGSVDMPHLYLEQQVSEGGSNYFKRVWDETTRHDAIIERIHAVETNVQEKADRAWGFYDSHSGEFAPDGFTSVSSENVIIAGGMAYQRTVTTSGAVWILTANDPTVIGGTSAGYFRISDDDGNALFEIVKGDRRTVGATATGLTMSGGAMVVTYTVQADEHPTIYLTDSLSDPSWQAEGTSALASVTWAGSSGAWTATITPIGTRPALFAKATYQAGGETYIKNTAPISVEGGIVVGNKKIRPRVNGSTVTWEVIP